MNGKPPPKGFFEQLGEAIGVFVHHAEDDHRDEILAEAERHHAEAQRARGVGVCAYCKGSGFLLNAKMERVACVGCTPQKEPTR